MNNNDIKLPGGHCLRYISGDMWELVTAEEWMKDYIFTIPNEDHSGYISVDCPNLGMPLLLGNTISKYKIVSMFDTYGMIEGSDETHFIVALKKIHKNYISELESGDYLYVVTPNYLGALLDKYVFEYIKEKENFENEFITIVVHKDNSPDVKEHIVVHDSHYDEDFMTENGIKIGTVCDTKYQVMFTYPDYAKKLAYNLCQDVIEKIRKNQRKIINI